MLFTYFLNDFEIVPVVIIITIIIIVVIVVIIPEPWASHHKLTVYIFAYVCKSDCLFVLAFVFLFSTRAVVISQFQFSWRSR
jgi:hypothetical protein